MSISSNNNLQKAYTEEKARAIELINKIKTAVNEEPEIAPNWGYFGSMADITIELQEIADRLCGEGEYAE